MKKCLLLICGLYPLKNVDYKSISQTWYKNLIVNNANVKFNTVFSYDSSMYTWKHDVEHPESWKQINEDLTKTFSNDLWGYIGAIDYISDQNLREKIKQKHNDNCMPEEGPYRPCYRILNILQHINLKDYDYCFYIRPDKKILNRVDIETDKLNILTSLSGGGYFHNRDWDCCYFAPINIFKKWIDGLHDISNDKHISYPNKINYNMMYRKYGLVSVYRDELNRFRINDEVMSGVVFLENYLYDLILQIKHFKIYEGIC